MVLMPAISMSLTNGRAAHGYDAIHFARKYSVITRDTLVSPKQFNTTIA